MDDLPWAEAGSASLLFRLARPPVTLGWGGERQLLEPVLNDLQCRLPLDAPQPEAGDKVPLQQRVDGDNGYCGDDDLSGA